MKDYYNSITIVCILIQGFLISRLFIYCGLSEFLAHTFVKKSKGNINRVLLYSLFTAILISLVTPNIICLFTMLPILRNIKDDINSLSINSFEKSRIISLLVFLVMFGANLGGTGSLTGSPLNVLVLWFVAMENIPLASNINFFTWLLWGIPFVIILGLLCFNIVKLFLPKVVKNKNFQFTSLNTPLIKEYHFNLGAIVTIVTIISWIIFSAFGTALQNLKVTIALFSIVYTITLIVFLFFIPLFNPILNKKAPLVPLKGISKDIPTKGYFIVVLSLILSYLFEYFKLDLIIANKFTNLASFTQQHFLLLIFTFAFFSIFMSEFFSNTASIILLFNIALPFSKGDLGIPLMFAITLAASVPSMTPMASPVNSFAYGSIENSFSRFLLTIGFFINIIAVVVITVFCAYFLKPLLTFI